MPKHTEEETKLADKIMHLVKAKDKAGAVQEIEKLERLNPEFAGEIRKKHKEFLKV